MRIIVNHADHEILQTEPTPVLGHQVAINGKYVIDVPEGTTIDVDISSYVLNGGGDVDAGSVVTDAMDNLLELFPSFDDVVFNPLITDDHIAELDLTAVFNDGVTTLSTRAQVGRSVAPVGNAANSVALLAQNDTTAPPRPGVLITDTIDISPFTAGAETFRVWWKLYEFTTTEDVNTEYGSGGTNTPSVRYITEIDQEPADLEVYLSNDDGGSYTLCTRLGTVSFCVTGTDLRLAFKNTGTSKLYLASYAILF